MLSALHAAAHVNTLQSYEANSANAHFAGEAIRYIEVKSLASVSTSVK